MTVEKFKEKFEVLRKEGEGIYREIKPLLKRLDTLSRKCLSLGNKAGEDPRINEALFNSNREWDTDALFNLWEFEYICDDQISTLILLLNRLVKTKFVKIKAKNRKSKKGK